VAVLGWLGTIFERSLAVWRKISTV